MKTIKLENEKLRKLLIEKSELITIGRAKSEEIEKLEKEMEEMDKQIQEEEKKVDVSDLNLKANEITDRVNQAIKEMDEIKQQTYARMKEQVPQELHAKYDSLKNAKDEAETERNKIAIKAQKYNEKIIPLGRKLMKPHLEDQFDDYDTIKIENDEIVCTLFNHIEEFKKNFNKK